LRIGWHLCALGGDGSYAYLYLIALRRQVSKKAQLWFLQQLTVRDYIPRLSVMDAKLLA
jgi:hypothetical protein